MKRLQSIDDKIIRSIKASHRSSTYTTKDFLRFGRPPAVGQALARLTRAGQLRGIRQGVYDLPQQHSLLSQTSPAPYAVIEALIKDSGARWQFSDAYRRQSIGTV